MGGLVNFGIKAFGALAALKGGGGGHKKVHGGSWKMRHRGFGGHKRGHGGFGGHKRRHGGFGGHRRGRSWVGR